MLSTLLGIAALSVGIATVSYAKNKVETGLKYRPKIEEAVSNFQTSLRRAGLEDMSPNQLIDELYVGGKINAKEYKQAIKTINELGDKTGFDKTWSEIWLSTDKSKAQNYIDLYNLLANNLPQFATLTADSIKTLPDAIRNAFTSKVPAIADAPAPNYEDTSFAGYQREVEPVKLWTGQELADLHNLDYNPYDYYDLIKRGTEAEVNLAEYTADQLAHASMVNDTQQVTDYLDSIRNTKADAILNGATLGARRANELLNNTETIGNYAANQLASAQNQYNTVDRQFLADAEAQLTARQYFDQLAKSLSRDSDTLYANDSNRFGQDWLSNAEFYTADQNLRGIRALANGEMAGAYAKAQAGVNLARQNAAAGNAELDEYKWVFDNFLRADNNNVQQAVYDTDNYIFGRYNNMSMHDYVLNATKK